MKKHHLEFGSKVMAAGTIFNLLYADSFLATKNPAVAEHDAPPALANSGSLFELVATMLPFATVPPGHKNWNASETSWNIETLVGEYRIYI